MQTDTIRRRTNGSIDIESYGREALRLRTQTRTDLFKRAGRLALSWPVIGAAALATGYAARQAVLASVSTRLAAPPRTPAIPTASS